MTPQERTRFAALVAVSAVSALSLTLTFIAGHAGASAPLLAGNAGAANAGTASPAAADAASEGTLAIGDPSAPVPGASELGANVGGALNPATQMQGTPGGPLTFRAMVPSDWLEIQGELAYEHALAMAAQQGQWLPDDDPKVVAARAIVAKLEPFALKWNDRAKGWKWKVSIIHSPELDAVCLPGGKILINDGLIERLGLNENETALLLAHLIAHALREHARSKIGEQLGSPGTASVASVASVASAASVPAPKAPAVPAPSAVPQMVGAPGTTPVNGMALAGTRLNVVPELLTLRYEAADETEADVIGADMASRAGFDPRAGYALWQKIDMMAKWKPTLPFVLEHPITEKRLADLKKRQKDMLPLYARALDQSVDDLPPYKPGRWNPPRIQRARDEESTDKPAPREARRAEPESHASPLSFLSTLPHRLAELFK